MTYTMPTTLPPTFMQHIALRHSNDNVRCGETPPLFATYTDQYQNRHRVRCVDVSKLGRVGITEHLEDETSPQMFVPAGSLSQFLKTPYPVRQGPAAQQRHPGRDRIRREARTIAAARVAKLRRMQSVDSAGLAGRVASLLHIPVALIVGEGKTHLSVHLRRALLGMLASRRPDFSLSMLGSFINVHHSSAHHALIATGLRGDSVSWFDAPFLRAAWRRPGMVMGYGPGEMPTEVFDRLGRLVVARNGAVEPSVFGEVRKWLALYIAAERMEELQCAA